MAWAYKVVSSVDQDGSKEDLQNELNSLNPNQMASAKVGTTVIRNNGEPFKYVGFLIYDVSIQSIPKAGSLETSWQQVGFSVKNDANVNMDIWQEVVDYLNNPANALTPSQKFYSVISMDHASDYANYMNTNVGLWYRNSNGS